MAQYKREGNKTPFLPLISCYNGKRVAKVFCIPIDPFLTLKQDSASPTCINCQNNCGVDVKTNADTSRCSRLFLQKACQEPLRWNKKYFYSVMHVLKVSVVNSDLHGSCLLWLGIPKRLNALWAAPLHFIPTYIPVSAAESQCPYHLDLVCTSDK